MFNLLVKNPFHASLVFIFAYGLWSYYKKEGETKRLECGID